MAFQHCTFLPLTQHLCLVPRTAISPERATDETLCLSGRKITIPHTTAIPSRVRLYSVDSHGSASSLGNGCYSCVTEWIILAGRSFGIPSWFCEIYLLDSPIYFVFSDTYKPEGADGLIPRYRDISSLRLILFMLGTTLRLSTRSTVNEKITSQGRPVRRKGPWLSLALHG